MKENPLRPTTLELTVSEWDWRTQTIMPPPNGKTGSDTGDWSSSVLTVYFTFKDTKGIDQSGILNNLPVNSEIRIQKATDSSIYSLWKVIDTPETSIEGTYIIFPVTFLQGNGSPGAVTCTCVFDAAPAPAPEPPQPPEPPYVTGGPPFPPFPSDAGRYGASILDWFAAYVMTGLAMRSDMSLDVLKADGAKHAYWIAATMVQVRNSLMIEPTPPAPDGFLADGTPAKTVLRTSLPDGEVVTSPTLETYVQISNTGMVVDPDGTVRPADLAPPKKETGPA